jgi:hypothetical protein
MVTRGVVAQNGSSNNILVGPNNNFFGFASTFDAGAC